MHPKIVKTAVTLVCAVVMTGMTAVAAYGTELMPVGQAVGINVTIDGAMVAGVSEVETSNGKVSPAAQAGVLPGDIIVRLGPAAIHSLSDFSEAAKGLDGHPVSLTVLREEKQRQFTVTPVLSAEGRYQLGLWLRDGITGIGTVTYYDPETGVYGALGHGINDVDTGHLIPVSEGEIYHAAVVGVVKGQCGTPGELTGSFDTHSVCGAVGGNTVFGIFGVYEGTPDACGDCLTCGEYGEAQPGKATIRANVSGTEVQEFDITIDRVYRENGEERFLITVTDPLLLDKTGGIVQGMSGSPILQNGKLVGAVTHVLTNDPSKGYGLGIQSMLDAAGTVMEARSNAA